MKDLTPEVLEGWWSRVRQQPQRGPRTKNLLLVRLKHALNKAIQWNYIGKNPAQFVKRLREPKGKTRFFTPDERERLLNESNPRLKWYIVTALYTGARRGSLYKLRQGDVDFEEGTITFRETKNGDDYTIPLHPVLAWLLPLRMTGRPSGFLLPRYSDNKAITRAFGRLCKRQGIEGASFHTLRHDVGARLGMAGANQRAIMDWLGHKDPRMSIRLHAPEPGESQEGGRGGTLGPSPTG